MLKNYFLTACRNLWRNRFYTIINVSGLAIGLAVGIIILFWVKDELSYDGFHSKANTIYKINALLGSGNNQQAWDVSPAPVAIYAKAEIPGIKNAVRVKFNSYYSLFRYRNKQFTKLITYHADTSFFSMFDFKLIKGNRKNPFIDNRSIIITQSTATKFFGKEEPMGKIIIADNKENFVVNGVMADFPDNSSIRCDILFSFNLINDYYISGKTGGHHWKTLNGDWGNYNYCTFLEIEPNTSLTNTEKRLSNLRHEHCKPEDDAPVTYKLQSLKDIHIYPPDGNGSGMLSIRIFMVVAILLLIIACINYVNLSTARAMLRAKEVSIRKIVGASLGQLFFQFVFETLILFCISSALALIIIHLLLPFYNELSGKHTQLSFSDTGVWTTIGITIIATLFASSIYPTILLSSFKPTAALKGKIALGSNAGFRKTLVITQFVFSILLISCTLVIAKQLQFIQDKELGFDKSQVFSIHLEDKMYAHRDLVKTELLKQPGVNGVSAASGQIIEFGNSTGDTDWDGKEPGRNFMVYQVGIDKDFIPLMKLKLATGANFTDAPADSAHWILNEAAIREMDMKDPIGKRFTFHENPGTIIGILKDFHFASLRKKIEPLVFYLSSGGGRIYIRTTGKDAPKAIAAAEKLWKQYESDFPFEYRFLDDHYNELYKSEQRTGVLFKTFAGIAIFISCLGLFGLAAYTAQVKTKEIGIRKVLGASIMNITGLLAKDFIKLVLIAIVIATPIAYLSMYKWLEDFVYRITLSWWVFIISAVLAIIIAIITVSFQSIKAAIANPVKNLRTE